MAEQEGPVYEETGEIYCLLLPRVGALSRRGSPVVAGDLGDLVPHPALIAVTTAAITTADICVLLMTSQALCWCFMLSLHRDPFCRQGNRGTHLSGLHR